MRKKIIGLMGFLVMCLISFGIAQTGDPVTTYLVSKTNGTCLSNGSITVSFPAPPSGTYQSGWIAELRIAGSTTQGQTISVPSSGGDITFNSLSPNNYSLTVANGFQTLAYGSNPISISSTYVNMSITASSVAPTCKNTALNYTDNGTFTINVPSGGIGPFLYTVNSPANGTQTFQTTDRSHTFLGMKGGETVSYSVQDVGCGATNSASFTIASNTSADLQYAFRAYNFIRDCADCNSATFYVNLDAATANIGNRLSTLQQPGNAIVTINGADYNLTYVGTLKGGHHRFRYDRPSGGPVLTDGMSIATKFNWGCGILENTTTVRMSNSFLKVFSTPIVDNSTCSVKYRLTMIGDEDASGSQRNIYFCEANSLTVEKLDLNTGLYDVIYNGSLGIGGLDQADPSASKTVELNDPGTYRVTATDACHTVVKSITINPSSPIDNVAASATSSVLEGTVGMSFSNLNSLKYPFTVKLERTDGQTSIPIAANNPLNLAANYTVNFPLSYTFNSNPGTGGNIVDLPPGEYKVTFEDDCTASTGRRKIQTINLTNKATYSPTFSVAEACLNSNSISYALNRGANSFLPAFVQLRTKNSDGSEGAIVSTVTNTSSSGTFNNLASGDYFVKFIDAGNGYSAARNVFGPFSYSKEVTISPYENIQVDISTVFCDVTNSNSGIVSAEVVSGTLIYPLTMAIYRQSDNALIQGPINITSPQKGTVFTGLSTGNYYIRTTSACYTFDKNFSLSTANTPPTAQVSQDAVCPGSPTTVAVISATNNLYDITWLIKNADGTEQIVGTGMPLPLSPTITTTYTARFSLKPSFGCQNPPVYESDVTVLVTENPDLVIPKVSDIDLCLNSSPNVVIADSQTDFIYEILDPQGLSYSPKVVSAISTGGNLNIAIPAYVSLTPGTKLKVKASNSNAGCSGILNDQVNILQSTANLSLNVEGSFVCVGSNGTIKVEGAESGVTYTVLKNGAPLSPSISNIGAGADLIFTIPAAQLNSATNTFTVQTSGANCATGVLAESGVITVQQAPSASTLIHAICGVQKGSITLSTFGGSGNYEYKLGSDGVWVSSNVFSDLNPGTYTVYSKDLTSGCESQNTIEILQYCLELTKVSTTNPNTYDSVGDVLTYNIIVKNTGNVPLSNIAVSDPGATLSSATISSLAVGASATLTASYNVNQADLDYGSFTNTANAQVIYNGVAVSASDSEIINASQVKSLNIIKTADKQNYALGDVITYTFAVKNTGNVTLGGISVADAMTGLSAISPTTVSSLAPGATSTFTATYTATQADVDAGKIENTATATGTFNSLNYTDSDTETILAVQNPSVSITKTAITSSYSAEGQVISYTIKVINDGDVTLSNIILNDPLTGLSQTILSLAPGANQEFSTSYTTNSADLSLTKIDNTATASYTFNGINHAEDDIASVPNANSINGLECGANSYSIANGIATNIMVKVPYAGGTASTYLQGQAINLNNGTLTATLQAGTINPTGGELVYQLSGTPANASQVTLPVNFGGSTCQVIIYITEPNQSSISTFVLGYNDKNNNCVKDSGENEEGLPNNGLFIKVFDLNNNLLTSSEISYGQFDILDLNINSDVIYYYIIDTNDSESDIVPTLPIGWSSGMGAPNLKRYFHFDGNILLQNTAPVANLVDPSWDGLTYPWRVCLSQAAGTIDVLDCTSTKFSGILAVNQVAGGRSFTIDYTGGNGGSYEGQTISSTGVSGLTATLVAGSLNAGSGTLTFSLSGKPLAAGIGKFNLTFGGKSCEISFTVEEPGFSVSKTIANSNYKSVGEVLNYNISVTNTGKIDLNNLIVKDPLTGLNQTITSLLAGANQTIATTYTVTQSDIDVGKIINKASATLSFGGQEYSEEAIAEIEAIKAPAINLTKTANKTSYTSVGDVITYTIVVNNTGNVTLSSVKVTDPLTAFDNTISTLAVGASQSFTTSYTVTQSDLDAGQIINIATGSYNYEGLDQEEKATATVLATRNPAIEITKVAAQTSFSKIGDVLNYTITLKNTGNVTLSNIIVTDPLTGMSETINSLAPNATRSFTTNYSITQSDLIAGKVDNTAKANLTYAGVDLVKTVTETVNGVKSPDLSIVKEAVQSSFEKVGDVLSYNIRVKNEGNAALVDIKVSDPLTGMNETIANLAVGESRVFTTSYTVTQLDINAEKIDNTAVASFTYSGTYYMKSASVTVPLAELKSLIQAINDNYADRPINVLETSKSGNVLANDLLNGQVIRPSDVNITVLNNGGLSGLIIDEDGYLVVPKGSPVGSYVVRYRICERVDPSNCSEANVILEVFHGVNLRIFKSVTSATWFEGNELEYQIRVENNGTTNATDVIAVDNLPEGLRYVSSKIANSAVTTRVNDQRISWTIPALARGENVEITLRVKAAPLTNGMPKTIVNIAQVSSKEMEMTPVDNSALATVRIDPFFIPNTITPNGDLTNDTFEIPGLNRFVSNELIIFNRWNDHVYQRKDYKNDWAAQGLVSGTYFYILKVKDEAGKTHDFKGYIQVVKESIR